MTINENQNRWINWHWMVDWKVYYDIAIVDYWQIWLFRVVSTNLGFILEYKSTVLTKKAGPFLCGRMETCTPNITQQTATGILHWLDPESSLGEVPPPSWRSPCIKRLVQWTRPIALHVSWSSLPGSVIIHPINKSPFFLIREGNERRSDGFLLCSPSILSASIWSIWLEMERRCQWADMGDNSPQQTACFSLKRMTTIIVHKTQWKQ